MQLDDLKAAWAAHGTLLERSLALNERLLREMTLRKVRQALMPYVLWRAVEVALLSAALAATVAVLVAHLTEPLYLAFGGALAALFAGLAGASGYLLVQATRLDGGGPVTAIQRHVESMKLVEYRAVKWALLGGVLLWLPAALVLFEALTGVAALARVDLAWLGANLALGVVVLAVGQALSRKHVERPDLGPWARRLVDAVSGRGLRRAAGHLTELAAFEREGRAPR
jgi:hypothetical protein